MKKMFVILSLLILPLTVKAESGYLYDVLKNEAENNGLAKEYTGEHHDSFTQEPTKKIYHWYAENDDEGNQVIEKNNVIFGNFCWQILRTTDTGGVKLIYNGIPNEGKCNNTSGDTTILSEKLNVFENSSRYIAYNGYMYNPESLIEGETLWWTASNGKYGNNVIYENGLYYLTDINNKYNKSHKYYCLGEESCSEVYYYHSANARVKLTDGRNITQIIDDLRINKVDSPAKEAVETWFQNNLVEYQKFIEDTIYCDNREIKDLGPFNPDGSTSNYLTYNSNKESLMCSNELDQFSINNEKAKLKYPVGLPTYSEINILNNKNIRKTGSFYWVLTHSSDSSTFVVNSSGAFQVSSNNNQTGIRPAISLKSNTKLLEGTGTKDNPYTIDVTDYYKVVVKEEEKKGDIEFEVSDINNLEEGTEVKFKITPVEGYELNNLSIIDEESNNVDYTTNDKINFKFTMPATDVTIYPQYKRIDSLTNPNTKRQIKITIIAIIILGIATSIYVNKKKKINN